MAQQQPKRRQRGRRPGTVSPLVLALRPVSYRDVEERLRNSVLSGMIVGRGGTSAISDFPAAHGLLGLLASGAHSKNAEILVPRHESDYRVSDKSAGHV